MSSGLGESNENRPSDEVATSESLDFSGVGYWHSAASKEPNGEARVVAMGLNCALEGAFDANTDCNGLNRVGTSFGVLSVLESDACIGSRVLGA